jgi:hypothetical protein
MLIVWKGGVSVSDLSFKLPFMAEEGSCFFELALLASHPLPCECTLTAKTFVTIAALMRDDLQKVLQYFPRESSNIGLNMLMGCYDIAPEVAADIDLSRVPQELLLQTLRETFDLIKPSVDGKLSISTCLAVLRAPSPEHRAINEDRISAVEECMARILAGSAGFPEFCEAMLGNFAGTAPASWALEQARPPPESPIEALTSPRPRSKGRKCEQKSTVAGPNTLMLDSRS